MTLRLDRTGAAKVAGFHDDAQTHLNDTAESAPSAIDGGYGSHYLLDILQAVAETAGQIAVINTGMAIQVRDVADDIGKTEDQIGQDFGRVVEKLR